MAKLTVDLGSVIANGADGDTAREAFTKVNSNFTEVYDNLQNQSGNLDTKVDKVAGKSLVDDTEIAKLVTVEANATQNSTDAYLLDRANHTGTQAISTVSGLQTAIDSKANTLDLGTAAYTDITAYATALQGSKADTAAQTADLGTAAYTASTDYATAAQGAKADTAAQVADLGTAAYQDAIAFEKLLSPGSGIMIDRSNPAAPVISAGGAGAGDVTGPNSSVADEVVLFDGATGKFLKGGGTLGTAAFTNELETVSQVDAEAGVATDRRIWTAERVKQAISSWWLSTSSVIGRSLASVVDEPSARELLGMSGYSGRNKLINANPIINQRNVSGTVTLVAGAYGHDRWKAGASGCTYTFSTSGGITTFNISAGSLQQVIEGINLQTGTYVMSWLGTSQGKIGSGVYSASGVTSSITGGSNLTVEFGTGTLALVQLELGTMASPFEHRSISQELELCQRYTKNRNVVWKWDESWNTGIGLYHTDYFSQMRAAPTATILFNTSSEFTNISVQSTKPGLVVWSMITTQTGPISRTLDLAVIYSAEL